ncbi:MAG: right-handed parallel beta-helix repeat-containing protein [Phormidesmis sp.]
MTTYYVSTNGVDSPGRDGLSWETAWQSLSFASEQVPAGNHVIQLGPGEFIATETARPQSGIQIVGSKGPAEETSIIASDSWPLSSDPRDQNSVANEYLLDLQDVQNISVQKLTLSSSQQHPITGAIRVAGSQNVQLHDLSVKHFRWSGLHLEHSEQLEIYNNHIENASLEKFRFQNGLIRTQFIKHAQIHHNTIVSTEENGYGYIGGGHENVRIHHNTFSLAKGFAIESAHENEFGVEIDHNTANQTISIPKGRQGADPNRRGYDYTFWIHHNFLTDSYTVEGPRNHLRISHNYVRIDQPNGRVYTHHGGNNQGPVWMHHNVIENVDRAVIWMNRGLAENIYVFNNTIFLANSPRAGAVLGGSRPERINNWIVTNNIIVAPETQPRKLFRDDSVGAKITANNNLMVNLTNVPQGNITDLDPELSQQGDKPFPFYAPQSNESTVVDRGMDVGFPFTGEAPDIGAYELGEDSTFPVSVQAPIENERPTQSLLALPIARQTVDGLSGRFSPYGSLGSWLTISVALILSAGFLQRLLRR